MRKLFLQLLPKILITRIVGFFTSCKLPSWILQRFIKKFIKSYNINMEESQPAEFKTFNDFFTRAIRPECRPINSIENMIVSPVDGTIAQFGIITNNTLIQAKGIDYPLDKLVVLPEYANYYANGSYITIYLSPSNYHRIHTPADGEIRELLYVPGVLYPVNFFAVQNFPGLFTKNERLLTILDHPQHGKIAVIKVGATIVGKIKVTYDTVEARHTKKIIHKTYENIFMKKGDELGRFQMGSTVILLFPPNTIEWENITPGQKIKFGEAIAKFLQ